MSLTTVSSNVVSIEDYKDVNKQLHQAMENNTKSTIARFESEVQLTQAKADNELLKQKAEADFELLKQKSEADFELLKQKADADQKIIAAKAEARKLAMEKEKQAEIDKYKEQFHSEQLKRFEIELGHRHAKKPRTSSNGDSVNLHWHSASDLSSQLDKMNKKDAQALAQENDIAIHESDGALKNVKVLRNEIFAYLANKPCDYTNEPIDAAVIEDLN